jgi:hypothetical protein
MTWRLIWDLQITLQRDTVDVGGNQGALTLGDLPEGVSRRRVLTNDFLLIASIRAGRQLDSDMGARASVLACAGWFPRHCLQPQRG